MVHAVWLRGTAGDKTTHALCMMDNQRYKHTFGICNTNYFQTATVITRTRRSVKCIRALPVMFITGTECVICAVRTGPLYNV